MELGMSGFNDEELEIIADEVTQLIDSLEEIETARRQIQSLRKEALQEIEDILTLLESKWDKLSSEKLEIEDALIKFNGPDKEGLEISVSALMKRIEEIFNEKNELAETTFRIMKGTVEATCQTEQQQINEVKVKVEEHQEQQVIQESITDESSSSDNSIASITQDQQCNDINVQQPKRKSRARRFLKCLRSLFCCCATPVVSLQKRSPQSTN
ncbi:---NA--- [Pelobates cultripes]|uniref:---NA n=1 Tax=Pelobates cultripes TaxID=61616 RepID=A0AAD1WBQ1_PELCU|nr:---NA--- [Pelobates cultripes]